MQIYSPSSRSEYSFCPRKFWLRKNGWASKAINYPELCAIGGIAIGKAMEVWNVAMMAGQTINVEALQLVGMKTLRKEFELRESQGRRVVSSKDQAFKESLIIFVDEAIRLLFRVDPLKSYAIVAAEEVFPHAGDCRLDVRVKQPDGRGIVFDYKVKFGEFEEKWLDKEFEKHFNGEQKYTYCTLTQTDVFGIILVVLKPRKDKRVIDPKIVVRTVPVTNQDKQVWLRDAQLLTPGMDQTLHIQSPTLVPGKTFPHRDEYGPCVYEDACIRYGLDESMMGLDYIQIKKEN